MLKEKVAKTLEMMKETGNHRDWCAGQVAKATSLNEAAVIAEEIDSRTMRTKIFCITNGVNKFGKPVNVKQTQADLNIVIESEIVAAIRNA